MIWSWIITIIIGLVVGWVASAFMRMRRVWLDIVMGAVGSVLGVWFFSMVLGIGPDVTLSAISLMGTIWAIVGAVIFIAIGEAIAMPGEKEMMRDERMHERGVAHDYEEKTDEEDKKHMEHK